MKFTLKRKKKLFQLFMGIIWFLLGILPVILQEQIKWNHYASLLLGSVYLLSFAYQNWLYYIEVNTEFVIENSLPKKILKVGELIEVKKSMGDYIFKSKHEEIRIPETNFNTSDLKSFQTVFEKIKNASTDAALIH